MSVTISGYLPKPYPIANQNQIPASPFRTSNVPGYPVASVSAPPMSTFASTAALTSTPTATHKAANSPNLPQPSALPSLPQTRQQFISLAKAAALITPAILLAKVEPAEAKTVVKELLPSDWKVWAKMGLSVATLSQVNKALNWNPPPWLSAFMNVAVMTGLMRNLGGNPWKVIGLVGTSVAGLAQLNHYASDKLKGPLQEKYNIPSWATDLGLSLASMGVGILAMPRFLAPLLAESKTSQAATEGKTADNSTQSATPRKAELAVMTPCASGCCASPICLNEVVNNVSLASEGIKKQISENKDRQR